MTLSALLSRQFQFPSMPRVLALMLNELDQPDVDLKKINQLVGSDPALTTRLLQVANSDAFALGGKVVSAAQALALLSLAQIRAIAQEAATGASLKAVPGINLQDFWDYCLDTAKVSRSIAGLIHQDQQAAFTAGLLHASGSLVMHVCVPQDMELLAGQVGLLDLRRASIERNQLGYNYADVGAGLARQWAFPQILIDALENQCAPFRNNVYEPLAGVVHLAVWRTRAREAGLTSNRLAVTFPGAVGLALGLDMDMVLQQDPFDWSAFA